MSTTLLKRAFAPFASLAAFPAVGDARKIYVAIDTAYEYRWDTATTAYVQVGGADNAGTAAAAVSTHVSATDPHGDRQWSADPSHITQDATHRFVSDTEKSTWNGKEDAGTAAAAVAAHVGAADPHGDRANAATLYQPLSAGKGLSTNDYTTDEKSKLAGIAAGATANSPDATLLARANHTGTQLAATISDFAATTRGTALTGLSTATSAPVVATDSVLVGFGKLQGQINGGSDLWKTLYFIETGGEACVIPLAATGDGSGVFTLRIWSDVANTARISAGAFYGELGGTTNLGTTVAMTAGAYTTFYVKIASGSATMSIDHGWALTKWGQSGTECIVEATNAPKLNGFNVKYIPSNVTTIRINSNQNTSIATGNTKPWAAATSIYFYGNSMTLSGTTYAWTAATTIYFTGASMTLSGTTYAWTAATYINFYGASMTLSGTTYAWTAATYINFTGASMTLSGTTYAWTAATYIYFYGASMTLSGTTKPWTAATSIVFYGASMTLSADLSTSCLTTGNLYIFLSGTSIAVTYPTTRAWPTTMRGVYLRPATGSMVQADGDRFWLDVDATCTTAITEKALDLRGNCAAPSAASAAARASLVAKGFTVSTN